MEYRGPHPDEGEEKRHEYRRDEDVAIHLKGNRFDLKILGGLIAAIIAFIIWLLQLNFAAMTQAEINGKQEAAITHLSTQVENVVRDQVKLATLIDAISQRLSKQEDRHDKLHSPTMR